MYQECIPKCDGRRKIEDSLVYVLYVNFDPIYMASLVPYGSVDSNVWPSILNE